MFSIVKEPDNGKNESCLDYQAVTRNTGYFTYRNTEVTEDKVKSVASSVAS